MGGNPRGCLFIPMNFMIDSISAIASLLLTGRNHQIQPEYEDVTRDGTAEPVSRDQILRRRERGQGNIMFPCSADHEQDWQPYPVDPYSCYSLSDDHITYIHTYIHTYY